ncbi:MAG: hypothetical protein WC796_02725 [Candidatus Pacearchaeota archaeon]|jgi:hypothetical protein
MNIELKSNPKKEIPNFRKTQFIGSSPPEIFVGQKDYPNVYTGILSPLETGQTTDLSMPETWVKDNLTIDQVMSYREKMIYSRFKTDIKKIKTDQKLISALNQVAMSNNSVRAEFILKKQPIFHPLRENSVPFIGNPAPLDKIKIQENPKIERKVDYVVSDERLKSINAIKDLYKSKIQISSIIKILSAGLLGLKDNRRMVPTRWAITATDDSLSKDMLSQIRFLPEINEFQLFHGDYVGNHYEILLLPDKFSFEVIETRIPSLEINKELLESIQFSKDYEGFFPRKTYADSVTGAYYANRLALCEYLIKIKRQASCIFFREVRPEYNFPLGVGILREASRKAFQSPPEKFSSISEALIEAQKRIYLPIFKFKEQSTLLKEFGKQKRLRDWF